MKQCHNWHCDNRNDNIVRINIVKDFLSNQRSNHLNKMIKSLKVSDDKVQVVELEYNPAMKRPQEERTFTRRRPREERK